MYPQMSAFSRHVFFFQAEDGIRDRNVTGVQTCALPISVATLPWSAKIPGPGRKPETAAGTAPRPAQARRTTRPAREADRSGRETARPALRSRSEEHTSELQSRFDLVCRLLLEKKKPRDS